MASLFRPVGRKKKPIQLRFTNSSSKIHKFLCTSLYLSRRSILKKTCQASEKSAPKPRFSGPFYTFPILFQTHSISSGNENKNIWCRDFHEIRASYSNSTYLNPVRVWVGPKTKFMVSWLLGKFVPESKPFFPSSRDAHLHVCFKKIFIHILRFVECNVTAVLNEGNCYTLF